MIGRKSLQETNAMVCMKSYEINYSQHGIMINHGIRFLELPLDPVAHINFSCHSRCFEAGANQNPFRRSFYHAARPG